MPDKQYADDATIRDDAELWRRIPPWHIVYDENRGRLRASSAAFEDHPNGSPMSIVLGDDILRDGRSAQAIVHAFPGFAIAAFTAGLARSCQQGIAREPLDDEPAHGVVFGRKTGSIKRMLAKSSHWVLAPDAPQA